MRYHLERIEGLECTDENLEIFGRAHYSYINQIFGDETVRKIIKRLTKNPGILAVEPSGSDFENSFHHIFKANRTKASTICSVEEGYQNITVDINDTLCQSYSLMTFLQIPFDKTPSENATIEMKHSKHLAMIGMYRMILSNEKFINIFSNDIVFDGNNELWEDTVDDENPFNIIEHYKTGANIIEVIQRVLTIWEQYGWRYFVGDGTCPRNAKRRRTRKTRKTVKG